MPRILGARSVLAVRDLIKSTEYYLGVLSFQRDPIEAEGWSFLSHGDFRLMLGECPDERSANELGNHSYFAWVGIEGVDDYHDAVRQRGAEIFLRLADRPWGMREFGVRTIDGHRMVFGERIVPKSE